ELVLNPYFKVCACLFAALFFLLLVTGHGKFFQFSRLLYRYCPMFLYVGIYYFLALRLHAARQTTHLG
ncbi:MAG TPA: hypothetical protein DF383_12635, partial [Deltaproteobacteria bacterium]|nr:hypothetical protein [Deltaproteobacteria bacterium]